MNAMPMIEQCMLRQCEYYGFYACQICEHEVTQNDKFSTMCDCGWCGHERILPVWINVKHEGDRVYTERGEIGVQIGYADA